MESARAIQRPSNISILEDHISISDPKLAEIPVSENGDKIVGLNPKNIRIVSTDDKRFGDRRIKTDAPTMREPIYRMLEKALEELDDDIGIAVFEGYRSREKQCEYFNNKFSEIKQSEPYLPEKEVHAK